MNAVARGNPFGLVEGREAHLFTLQSDRLRARVTNYGGILVSLEMPDRGAAWEHVVLGFDDITGYLENRGSFGALLGRTANRIAGGRLVIDGHVYELSKNENGSTLHGGAEGFGKKFWSVTESTARYVTLALVSPDGDQGFPGEVVAEATWRVDGCDLSLTFVASTVPSVSASAKLLLSWLNPTPHPITVYASHPPSPTTAQHSLPGGALPPYRGRSECWS